MENKHTILEKQILCFSSKKNRKLKGKRWWIGACNRKKRAFFVPFILFEGNFFNTCVLSQCIVYWIHFQNIHTYTYICMYMYIHTEYTYISKSITPYIFLLVFKIVESLQCILKLTNKLKSISLYPV